MILRLARVVGKVDRISENILIWVNLGIAAFVGIAHGAGLAVSFAQDHEHLDEILPVAIVSLPLAGFIIISSILVLLKRLPQSIILPLHAIILCLGGAAIFIWAVSIFIKGFPKGNFAWSPGLMTFLCVYPACLLRRTVLRKRFPNSAIVKYLHVIVLILVLPVDIGLFLKVISHFSSLQEY